jgi:hypothetical protein
MNFPTAPGVLESEMSEALPVYVLADNREGFCAARCSDGDGKP